MSNNLFICESCGGVTPDDCLRCPDRGNGKGVTVERIKDDLQKATNNAELQACRKHYGRHIATLKRSQAEGAKVMAIQIENLVDYLYAGFRRARR